MSYFDPATQGDVEREARHIRTLVIGGLVTVAFAIVYAMVNISNELHDHLHEINDKLAQCQVEESK